MNSPKDDQGNVDSGPAGIPETKLVQRTRNGDVEAFEELLNRHQDRVTRVVFSILKDPMDTEEITQDVFLTVFEKIERFRGDASFSTWIHRIAVNAALMHKRRDKSSFDVPLDDVLPAFEDNGHIAVDVADWSPQTNDPALQEETRSVIQAAVDRLNKKYQTVFMLRDIEGFSTEETAQILAMGIPAIKSRLHRARLSLRKELANYFERAESA